MIHKGCKTKLQLDLTASYSLRSPEISISTKGIMPAMLEITRTKRAGTKLICPECEETYSNREELENNVLEQCSACGEYCKPSELIVTDYIPLLCNKCKEKPADSSPKTTNGKLLLLFSEVLKDKDYPTLLTLIMKK